MSKDKLTDSKLRTAKPEAKEYSLGDGDGLYLRVKCSPPPKMKKSYGENEKLPAQ